MNTLKLTPFLTIFLFPSYSSATVSTEKCKTTISVEGISFQTNGETERFSYSIPVATELGKFSIKRGMSDLKPDKNVKYVKPVRDEFMASFELKENLDLTFSISTAFVDKIVKVNRGGTDYSVPSHQRAVYYDFLNLKNINKSVTLLKIENKYANISFNASSPHCIQKKTLKDYSKGALPVYKKPS